MAKRREVGSVVKGKDGKPPYIKLSSDVSLKKGQYLNLESKATQLKSLEGAVEAGKISAELGATIKERFLILCFFLYLFQNN